MTCYIVGSTYYDYMCGRCAAGSTCYKVCTHVTHMYFGVTHVYSYVTLTCAHVTHALVRVNCVCAHANSCCVRVLCALHPVRYRFRPATYARRSFRRSRTRLSDMCPYNSAASILSALGDHAIVHRQESGHANTRHAQGHSKRDAFLVHARCYLYMLRPCGMRQALGTSASMR